jgi:hypothetical protein
MIFLIPFLEKRLSVSGADGVKVIQQEKKSFLVGRRRLGAMVGSWDVSVDMVNKKVFIGKGYVDELEPKLDDEPISGFYHDGKASDVRPSLPLGSGIQCVVLKITPNDKGRVTGKDYLADTSLMLEMKTLDDLKVYSEDELLVPLALINDGSKILQIAHFNYRYKKDIKKKEHYLFSDAAFTRAINDDVVKGLPKEEDVSLDKLEELRKEARKAMNSAAKLDPDFPYPAADGGGTICPAKFNADKFLAKMVRFG